MVKSGARPRTDSLLARPSKRWVVRPGRRDSDSAIEDAAGLSAAEVYERFGEQDFRDGERRLVSMATLKSGPSKVG